MNTLLLCIDFINDIVHPEGKIASSAKYIAEHRVIAQANAAIKIAREKNIFITQVKVGFSNDYIECPQHSPLFSKAAELGALKLSSWGCKFHDSLDIKPEDNIIVKHRVSALYATSLQTILNAHQITQVVLCGVTTNMAIETTARELHDRDYDVVILEDACGAASLDIHQASLTSVSRISQILSVKDWTELLYK